MKIKIERSQKAKTPKKKKERVVLVGKHRKMVLALWLLLSCSLAFGIYKNFTAIDQHTNHEKVVVKEKIVNTSGVETFTKDFAKEYFSWKNNKEFMEKRMTSLEQYFTKEGLALSRDMVRADIPTSSEVQSIKILNVAKKSKEFVVSILVDQKITEAKKPHQVSHAYRVTIYEDEKGNHIVTSLPTMIGKPEKAQYEEKQEESDSKINAKTTEEITDFLETFFKIYPTASEKELEYYIENEALIPLNTNLKFVELVNPIYKKKTDKVQAKVAVRYLDDETKTIITFEYKILLFKKENWQIISSI